MLPVVSALPSGRNANPCTKSECFNVALSLPVATSHTRTVPSFPPDANVFP